MKLKELRLNKQMTQIQVAEYLKITKQGYSHYETGTREPDVTTLRRLADLYGVSIDYIVGRNSPDTIVITNDKADNLYQKYLNADINIREAIDKLLDIER